MLTVTVLLTMASASPALASGDRDTVGLADPVTGLWHLMDRDGDVASFYFGNPGDVPFMGDWDCDGIDTPGLYRQSDGFVYLRNANTTGIADIEFFFGNPGDQPIAGDFNGNGCDTVSIYRPAEGRFFIINVLGSASTGLGAAEFDYPFGDPGDKPFVGDFNGNGTDTVGLHRESTGRVYFRNSHTAGVADASFIFGDPGDRFVAGDWTNDGKDTPVLFRSSDKLLYFRFTNTEGVADQVSQPGGEAEWTPVAGYFGNLAAGPLQPEKLKVTTGGGSGELAVSWEAVAGAASYRIYRTTVLPGAPKTLWATASESVSQFGGPWPDGRRSHVDVAGPRFGVECFGVTAVDAAGREGPMSGEVCFTPTDFMPSATTGGGSGEIGFSWKGFAGVDHYDVYWSLLPRGTKTKLASVSNTTDQFGVPWTGDTRLYIDGLPPGPPRRPATGLNCYIVLLYPSATDTAPAALSGEACFKP
jgi:hypothetical protein